MQFSGIQKIKYLQPYEHIENNSKMPWIILCSIKSCLIVYISIDMEKSTTTYITTNDPISPFELRICDIGSLTVICISILWDELLPHENYDQ